MASKLSAVFPTLLQEELGFKGKQLLVAEPRLWTAGLAHQLGHPPTSGKIPSFLVYRGPQSWGGGGFLASLGLVLLS